MNARLEDETPQHDMDTNMAGPRHSRRGWLASAGGVAVAGWAAGARAWGAEGATASAAPRMGNIRHSVVRWCFNMLDIETLARESKRMGIESIELVDVADWPTLEKHGLKTAIARSHSFTRGWNHKQNHVECRESVTKAIENAAAFGCQNVITFSGMREGLSDDEGMDNMVEGLKTVLPLAEKLKVNVCLEVLNSRVNIEMKGHPDYQCDTIESGVRLCERLGSPRMKILFDVYHVQIMQGDIITRLRQYKDHISHYHTAGVPGRNDLDETQEINYPPIMRAIAESGFTGFVGHEFIPKSDPVAALRQGVDVCDV